MNPIIEDHFMNPRNAGLLEEFDFQVNHANPICGDRIELRVKLDEQEIVSTVGYRAYGCSTALATASIVSEFLKGRDASDLYLVSRSDVAVLLGELGPRQRHCIDIGYTVLSQVRMLIQPRDCHHEAV